MDRRSRERMTLGGQLRSVLERDELEVHYQPQIDAATGAMIGFEALLRWRHPEHGYVAPMRFIPIAEEIGLIGRIGNWVLRRACADGAVLRREGRSGCRISVNLSARQLQQADIAELVARALSESGLNPADLELEITESSVMADVEHAAARMRQLADLGVRLALDDFGTGYSSLAYLKRFPIHRLKIDQSFVRDLPGDPDDAVIVRTIAAMAEALNLGLIAEGVETEAQRDFLLALPCRAMQGYLFCRPLPLDELMVWLMRRSEWGCASRV
jgi:EAL domain-containing protein (putative c-di-GMP-specific phosphodiesterase class I)